MVESNLPKGKIEFLQFHQPALKDGEYTVQVKQTISSTGKIASDNVFRTTPKRFRVAGERFAINPIDIRNIFPPENSSGDHSMVMPHIILSRSTLPWERFAENGDNETPWLTLLVFNEDEMARIESKVVTFNQLTDLGKNVPRFPALNPEQEKDDDRISVIDVPWEVLEPLLPSKEALRLQAHVRQAKDESDQLEGAEMAVLVANRLPESGKMTTVHLVSLEDCLEAGKGSFYAADAAPTDLIRLVTLKNWRFSCETHKGSFTEIIDNLNLDPPYLRQMIKDGSADPIIDLGSVPLSHVLRDGSRTVSIYRGPLVAYRPEPTSAYPISLPATTADELLIYDQKYGIFNAGYAAAWELGRLLTLRSNRVATELFQWKRNHVQQLHRAEQILAHPHLPGHQQEPPEVQTLRLPDIVEKWFDDLRNLKGLPFNYLVPDETMLPVESLRVFWVDPFWVAALIDGAFSIGRVTDKDHEIDRKNSQELFDLQTLRNRPVTGALTRSEAVSGWPDLLVDGYATVIPDKKPHPAGKLVRIRQERLSAGVLICLFDGEAQTLEIHQKPETLHFGLNVPDDDHQGYYKKLRNTAGEEASLEVSDIPWRDGVTASRIIDIGAFASKIEKALQNSTPAKDPNEPQPATLPFTSAQFALEMIEGVQKVIFEYKPEESPTASLDDEISKIKSRHGLLALAVNINPDEVTDQTNEDDAVSFLDALGRAIVSSMTDGSHNTSPFGLIKNDPVAFGLTSNPEDEAIVRKLRTYLNLQTSSIMLLDRNQQPEHGESVQENWIFRLILTNMRSNLFWSVVDRKDNKPTYNYGNYDFNLDGEIRKIRKRHGAPALVVNFNPDEVTVQTNEDDTVSFLDALGQAIVSFMTDGSHISSPIGLIKNDPSAFGLTSNPDDEEIIRKLRAYVNRRTSSIILLDRDQQPKHGESVRENWIFRLILTDMNSRLFWSVVDRKGKKPTYNYGYSLDDEINRIKRRYGIPALVVNINPDEVTEQTDEDDTISFLDALEQAIVNLMTDGRHNTSPRGLIKHNPRAFGLPSSADDEDIMLKLRTYVELQTSSIILLDQNQQPEHGESVQENWIFRLNLPDMSSDLFWSVVDRKGNNPTYSYGNHVFSLDDEIDMIKRHYGIPALVVNINPDEVTDQTNKDDPVSFLDALEQAIVSFMTDGSHSLSPFGLIKKDPLAFGLTWRADDEAITLKLRSYLNLQTSSAILLDWTQQPKHGESVQENWIFRLKLTNMSRHSFWSVVDRKGNKRAYNYGYRLGKYSKGL